MTQYDDALSEEVLDLAQTLEIPPCPEALAKIVRESMEDEPDFNKIATLIAADPSLAALMLKTVNSALYAPTRPISSIGEALSMLGYRSVTAMVRNILLRRAFPQLKSPGMQRFWTQSGQLALASAAVAGVTRAVPRDDAYSFGLFRDCGMPVIRVKSEDFEPILLGEVAERGQALVALERERFGVAHPEVGAVLARGWHLPEDACHAIRAGGELPEGNAGERAQRMAAVGRVAEAAIGGSSDWPQACADALEVLGVDSADAPEIAAAVERGTGR